MNGEDDILVVNELFFSDTSEGTEEEIELGDDEKKKIVWKKVLRTGTFAMTPGLGGAKRKPFKVIAEGESDSASRTISMSDLIEAFDGKAFDHVTIPTRHEDQLLDNTGYVQKLRTVKEGDTTFLEAGLGFTEPDIAGKVRRGTIPNVSCGIFFDFVKKATGKKWRAAMKHTALTHTPWIDKLPPFKAVFASDDEIESEPSIEGYQFAEGDNIDTTPGTSDSADIVWSENKSLNGIRDQLESSLNPQRNQGGADIAPAAVANYYVQDISTENTALVREYAQGGSRRFVIPFSVDGDGNVSAAPATRWVEAKEAMIAASDDNIADNFAELSSDMIRGKLGLALSEMLGEGVGQTYSVEEVTLDHRARIKSKVDGATWIAEFAERDGDVLLSASSSWASVEASEPSEQKTASASEQTSTTVTNLSDKLSETPEGRVQLARQQRRQLMSSRSL